jgi:uncharacterized membrane protein
MNLACPAAIGAVSGLRTFTGPAIIAEAAKLKLLNLKRTPLSWLASDRTALVSAILAGGELLADKLPFMPDRTDPPSLAGRFLAGAICGAAVSSNHKRNGFMRIGASRKRQELLIGAIVGGTAALAASYAGFQYRKHVKLPPVVAALLEDGVAVGVGAAVVSAVCR